MKRIIVIGSAGQVGWELVRSLQGLGEVMALTRLQCNLDEPAAAARGVAEMKPDLVINAAAYTAVDAAETDQETARRVNADGPRELAAACRKLGAPLIHYSTDYVFDGKGSRPYETNDPPAPLNIYGKTKLAGEQAVQESGAQHLILRTSWVYGARGKNFYTTMQRLVREREQVRVVADQIGAPTWSRAIAAGTAALVAKALSTPTDRADLGERQGIYHLVNAGFCSWADFAEAIARRLAAPALGRIVRITTAEYPTAAARPLNSRLASSRLFTDWGIALPPWQASLELAMESSQ